MEGRVGFELTRLSFLSLPGKGEDAGFALTKNLRLSDTKCGLVPCKYLKCSAKN